MAITHPDDILTTAEVCRFLKITRPTLYHWIAEGRLAPWKKLGGGSTFLFLRCSVAGASLAKYSRRAVSPPARTRKTAQAADPDMVSDNAADLLFISRDAASLRQSASDLQNQGYRVSVAEDLSRLEDAFGPGNRHDIVVLDLDAASAEGAAAGWRLFERVKLLAAGTGRQAPVFILLSGRHTSPKFAAEALKKGAWDFLKKPAAPSVFTARIRQALRRRFWSELDAGGGEPLLTSPDRRLALAPGRRVLEIREPFEQPVVRRLTRKESELLCLFLKRPGVIFSKATLLELIWGYVVNIRTRTVDCHIKNLRGKLAPLGGLLETRYGSGYRFAPPR